MLDPGVAALVEVSAAVATRDARLLRSALERAIARRAKGLPGAFELFKAEKDPQVRRQLLQMLAMFGDDEAADFLLELLEEK